MAAMWRDRLAGKKALIVLDNAASSEQVRPLLPSHPGCLVLITSRRRLAALEDVEPLTLGTLPPAEAAELFTRSIGPRGLDADAASVVQMVRLCGYLPLAIRLLAGRLRSHSSWTMRDLADMLTGALDRLAELHAENVAVEAAFELSYRDLSPEQQRLFRRLGLHPGPEVDAYAAAALDSIHLTQARRGLEALYNDHLVDESLPGRYRLHDLVRAYVRCLASQDDARGNDAAVDRLLDYYQHASTIANRRIAPRSDPTIPPLAHPLADSLDLSNRPRALAWLEAERGNLGACIDHAAAHSRPSYVVSLANEMHTFLDVAGHWDQALAIHRLASTAARLTSDRLGQANALNDLGIVQRMTGDHASAIASLTEALALFRDLGHRLRQANALYELGVVQRLAGDYTAATADLTETLTLFRSLDDRPGQANALNDLALVHGAIGEYPAATSSLTEALTLFRDLDDRIGATNTLYYLGVVQRLAGEYPAATASLTEALIGYRALGHRRGQRPQRPRPRAVRDRRVHRGHRLPDRSPCLLQRARRPVRSGERTLRPRPRAALDRQAPCRGGVPSRSSGPLRRDRQPARPGGGTQPPGCAPARFLRQRPGHHPLPARAAPGPGGAHAIGGSAGPGGHRGVPRSRP